MLQFLPMIMSLIQGKQKDAQAQKQNEISAMMGQAPTAQGGNMGQAMGSALMGGLQGTKAPGQSALDTIEGKKGGSTSSMLDSALGHKEPDEDDFGGPSDNDEDDLLRS